MEIKPSIKLFLIPAILFAALFVFGNEAKAADYYVDNTTTNCDTSPHANYDPATDTCGSGSYTVHSTIQGAADVVNPGDTVIVADGTYTDEGGYYSICDIKIGGSVGNIITFKAETLYGAILDGSWELSSAFRWSGSYDYINIENFYFTQFDAYAIRNKSGDAVPLSGDNIVVKNNSFYNTAGYHDGDLARNNTIENNKFILRNTWFSNGNYAIYPGGQYTIIQNNIFDTPAYWWFIHIPPACENIKIINNTFNGNMVATNEQGHIMIFGGHTENSILIQNNIFNNPRTAVIDCWNFTGYPVIMKNNLSYGTDIWYSAECNGSLFTITDEQTNIDPSFVNIGNHDYHLQADSLAIDAGIAANAPSYDIEGVLRPQGTTNPKLFDIGAYEYQGGQSDTTPPSAPTGLTVQ